MNYKRCLTFGTAFLLTMLPVFGIVVMTAGRFLTSIDTLSLADAIVVLGGDGADFARLRQAIRLFHQGYASTVVLCTPLSKNVDHHCSPAQQKLEVAQRFGLPADAAIITYGVQSTYDEAIHLQRLVRQHGWHSLIVVTDPFHTRRAGRTFRTLLPDVTIYVSAALNSGYNVHRWWQTEESLMAVFSEAIKLTFYWTKYGVAPIEIWPRKQGS